VKVAKVAMKSRNGAGNIPRARVTIAAIQIVKLVYKEGIVTVTVSSTGSLKKIITITLM
jgi:hypothetical protein